MSDDAMRISGAVVHLIQALEGQNISANGLQISLPRADAIALIQRMKTGDMNTLFDSKHDFHWPHVGTINGVPIICRD